MTSEPQAQDPVRKHRRPQPRFNGNNATRGHAKGTSQADGPADSKQQGLPDDKGLKSLFSQFQELQQYALDYASARTDGVKHSLWSALGRLAPAAIGVVAMAGLIVLASWLALSGLAQGVGTMFGDRPWIGELITGGLVLVGITLWVTFAAWIRRSASRKRTVKKYEARHARQRTRLKGTCMTGRQYDLSIKSEGDFLEDRAADAQKAMVRSLGDMKNTVSQMTDVRSRAAQHPWTMVGSAAAVGIVAGAMLTPSRRKGDQSGPNTALRVAAEALRGRRDNESPHTTKSLLFSLGGTVLAAVLPRLLQSWFAPAAPAKGEPTTGASPPTGESTESVTAGSGMD